MDSTITAIGLAVVSAGAALIGATIAFSKQRKLNRMLGFVAGALIGLVAFDLLPEIFEITTTTNLDITWPMVGLVVGFLLFHTIEKSILIHHSHEHQYAVHKHPHVGVASAVALVGHSFLDGMGIGLAFQVNNALGAAVAIAVIGHRFADGFNSVTLMLYHNNNVRRAKQLLTLVAIAPILGAISTQFFTLGEDIIAIYLGFFAGFLLYIGASDILPQAHTKNSSRLTIALTILGALTMFGITRLA